LRLNHSIAPGEIDVHRLFNNDWATGFQNTDADIGVHTARRAYCHGVNAGVGQE
jgi:hypothetical protein